MDLALLGDQVAIPLAAIESERIHQYYTALASKAVSDFDDAYESASRSGAGIVATVEAFGYQRIDQAINGFVDLSVKAGVFNYDLASAAATYDELSCGAVLMQALEELRTGLDNIAAQSADEAEHRASRRAGRARLVGGGFGIGGIAKGIAEAALYNMASGTVHGVVNLAGGARSAGRSSDQVRGLIAAKRAPLKDAIGLAITDVYAVHVTIWGRIGLTQADSLPGRLARIAEAAILHGHLRTGRVPAERQLEVLLQCIRLDPGGSSYIGGVARRALDAPEPGAQLAELSRLTEAVGVDVREAMAIAYQEFYRAIEPTTDQKVAAGRLRFAAETLGYDNAVHSCNLVAAEFATEALRGGVEGFRDGAERLTEILYDRREMLPITVEGVAQAIRETHAASLRELAKAVFIDALAGNSRYLVVARTGAFAALMVAFNLKDVANFFGGNKLDEVRKKIMAGTYASAQGDAMAEIVVLLAPLVNADARSVIAEMERFQADNRLRQSAVSGEIGSTVMAVCATSSVYALAVGDRISAVKLGNARLAFPIGESDPVFALFDDTLFGNNKNGVALCGSGLVWRNSWTTDAGTSRMTWDDFASVEIGVQKKAIVLGAKVIPLTIVKPNDLAVLLRELQAAFRRGGAPILLSSVALEAGQA